MDEKTLTALKESIAKWEERAAGDHHGKLGLSNCPLCELFHPNCKSGCPVAQKTGDYYCIGSPYHTYNCDRTDLNARAELDFLKSLLPVEEREEVKPKAFNWTDLKYLR
jgi:hypothetical protein